MHSGLALEDITDKVVARFWRKVQITDSCWLWTAAVRSKRAPYGVLSVRLDTYMHVDVPAHVVSFIIHNNMLPEFNVLHTCDTPRCVRPDHLYDGTLQQNAQDMVARGRRKSDKGMDNPSACLTDSDVKAIRNMQGHALQREIAAQFGITQSAVCNILQRKSWQHV